MRALIVTSSFSPTSHSTAMARHVQALVLQRHPDANIETLDLANNPPPLYNGVLNGAIFAGQTTPEALAALQQSDEYIAQLRRVDLLVLAIPMHNFGVPATLKSWMDQVARAGVTFEYTAAGPHGLVKIPALVVAASGGVYEGMPWAGNNHATTHATTFLGFLGMDVKTVSLEGTASKPAEELRASIIIANGTIANHLNAWHLDAVQA